MVYLNSGYSEKKVTENIEAEIFQVCLDEARESYKAEIIWELASNTVEDMENNLKQILAWIQQFKN